MELATRRLPQSIPNAVVPTDQGCFDAEEDIKLNLEKETVVASLVNVHRPQCNIVHGGAGTVKSMVLKTMRNQLEAYDILSRLLLHWPEWLQ